MAQGLELGLTATDACRAAGVYVGTLYDWLKRDRDGQPEYAGLDEIIDGAKERGQLRLAKMIWDKAPDDWKAAAWVLARRFREQWGDASRLDISGQISQSVDKLSSEQLVLQLMAIEDGVDVDFGPAAKMAQHDSTATGFAVGIGNRQASQTATDFTD